MSTKPPALRETLSDFEIDAIAEAMPGGLEGFLKTWGWRQYARAIEDAVHGTAFAVEIGETKMSSTERAGGGPLPDNYREINPVTGQQTAYVVLSPEERAKGFVQPVRKSYIHLKCGASTSMSQDIAETYARDPSFYNGTFCATCCTHFPLVEFVWEGTNQTVGSTKETI